MEQTSQKQLLSDGYCILSTAISEEECSKFYNDCVLPAINEYSDYIEQDPSTYADIPGDMIRDRNVFPNEMPIKSTGHWSRLNENPSLLDFLDNLHGGRDNWT
jgi:hypothetical protein